MRRHKPPPISPFLPLNDPVSGVRTTIPPEQNSIIGMRPLLRYLKIRSPITLYRWIDEFGLPAIKRPDGIWMSSCTAIDTWIFLCAELDFKNRRHSRGTGLTPEKQLAITDHLPEQHPRRRRALLRYNEWLRTGSSKPGSKDHSEDPHAHQPHTSAFRDYEL